MHNVNDQLGGRGHSVSARKLPCGDLPPWIGTPSTRCRLLYHADCLARPAAPHTILYTSTIHRLRLWRTQYPLSAFHFEIGCTSIHQPSSCMLNHVHMMPAESPLYSSPPVYVGAAIVCFNMGMSNVAKGNFPFESSRYS